MDEFFDNVNTIISSVPLLIIVLILGIDSIRAILASLGIINPDTKLGHIIYGKRDKTIIYSVLKDLGYSSEITDDIVINLKEVPKSVFMANAGVNAEDADVQLIILLSRYILEFSDIILYGGKSLTKSNYYIDTMEISYNKDDKQKLAAIMVCLLYSKRGKKKAPDLIITPKGGNPIFVQQVAVNLNSHLISAKSMSDKSRIKLTNETAHPQKEFLVNYEGSWSVEKKKEKQDCVVMDCNASGGSQLIDIVKDLRTLSDKNSIMIQMPSEIYILFRADTDGDNIDATFEAHQCTLYRFFDLDEEAKAKIYELKSKRQEEGKLPSYYNNEDINKAKDIIQYLKKKGLYYY